MSSTQSPRSITLQRCDDAANEDHIFGLAVDMNGDLAAVQGYLRSWSAGQCVDAPGAAKKLDKVAIFEKALEEAEATTSNSTDSNLSKRGTCRTIKVHSGNGCAKLASRYGISGNQFMKFNTKKNLCSTLAVGQRVCCSAGGLPDIRPKPNDDGSCHAYKVQSGDTCSKIAASNGLSVSDLSDFNDGKTWGWFGCNDLLLGIKMCLSKGSPPMPAPVSNAQCGPTVPGTKKPTNGTELAALNPCPLKACCDIWGQCGITPAYCTQEKGPTGNPGTAPKGKNGCVSHCGMDITNQHAPNSFAKVGYYESWNWDRPCLNLRTADLNTAKYTHIHWAFAEITDDFDIKINDTYNQWQDFLDLDYVNRVVSLGGWGYSTSPKTYNKLRHAMDPANVDTFVHNVKRFVLDNNLDGIDFD